MAVTLAVLAVISGVVVYAVNMMNKVEENLKPEENATSLVEEIQTLEEYKGDVVNILVCGIDYEEGRAYSSDGSNDGMTDMILYCQFDIKGGALRMLQIPRNSLVATQNRKITLSNGKTYAATNYQINSVALSNGGDIAALAEVIYDQYKLPIDYYVTIDMQALVEMVDNFGGIEVYIPHDMSFAGSVLKQGYRNLDGASAEFFVRCRHGEGYANSDIDRLNMQRYFYAGLFKRVRSMGVTDVIAQLPLIFNNYIHTDMDLTTIAKMLVSFTRIDSANIMLAQTPVFMGVPNVGKTSSFDGYSCVVPDAGSIAELLNTYFRNYTGPVSAEEMNLVTNNWPHGTASTSANVQFVGQLDKTLAIEIAKILDKKKAQDVRVLKVESLTVLTDYFVIASGTSTTQVGALADEVEYELSQKGIEPYTTEGFDSKNWVLLDYSSVIVHVFVPNTRTYYDLEHLWADGEPMDISEYLTPENSL